MHTTRIQGWMDDWSRRSGTTFELRLHDGRSLRSGARDTQFVLSERAPGALVAAATGGYISLLSAYFDGRIDLLGDLGEAIRSAVSAGLDRSPGWRDRLADHWAEWLHPNRDTRTAKIHAVSHYGLPEAFYREWLDTPLKLYTCAYWPDDVTSLEEAQRRKVEHIARKIRLSSDESLLDIGCGFGGFLLSAAADRGVRAVGTNTATEQVRWVRDEIVARGLQDRARVVEADLRDRQGVFDKVVSIGVLEHAGRGGLDEVIAAHADQLAPGGLGLLHFIGHVGRHATDPFIRRFVFPGGWIPALSDVLAALEQRGLEVLDVENLRRHYARTLDEWARRFAQAWPRIRAIDPARFDERFRRTWLVYLTGCAEMFRASDGHTHLFQVVFSKGNVDERRYPMTRDFLYR
jgi:cyclopropane-fatty-acyl-phospholipid synthase